MDRMTLALYADADFAGDRPSFKSTSGAGLYLEGPNTVFPLTASSKRPSCAAHSTPEAEIVAANAAVRLIGLPSLDLWDTVVSWGRAHDALL